MKNVLNFFYNLNPENIHQHNQKYYFYVDNELYYFIPYHRELSELKEIYNLNQAMVYKNNLIHKIILNKDKNIVTLIKEKYYILIKVYINPAKIINLSDIDYVSKIMIPNNERQLNRYNWQELWSTKIDYFENQISEIGQKYPIICDTFNYYIGLAENAISYLKNIEFKKGNDILEPLVVAHKRITFNMTAYELYNPLNFIIDNKTRDISEYIKTSFFNGKDIWDELHEYFNYNRLSVYNYNLLFARLLYPSYYFDIYDEIVNDGKDESLILKVVDKSLEYEEFLIDIYYYFSRNINIEEIDWITKKRI